MRQVAHTPGLEGSTHPTPSSAATRLAFHMWSVMGKKIDWEALPVLLELYHVPDIEQLIDDLTEIRDFDFT